MESSTSTSRKSQIWSLDLVVGILIFLGALLVFYKYSINTLDYGGEDESNLLLDAKLMSSYIMSEGYPADWSVGNVTLIGLTKDGVRIDPDKVAYFSSIAVSNYTISRRLLSTSYDYLISFEDKEGSPVVINGVSSIGKNFSAEEHEELIKVERLAIYDSGIIRVLVHIWE